MPHKVTIQSHAVAKHDCFELLQAAHAWLHVTTAQLYNLLYSVLHAASLLPTH